MRQAAKRGIITVMATGSVLATGAGCAHAASGAVGAATDSPGVASGNTAQVPVEVPVNVCGNTVDVVGLLNPAMGNDCANGGGSGSSGSSGTGSGGPGSGSSGSDTGSAPGASSPGGSGTGPGTGSQTAGSPTSGSHSPGSSDCSDSCAPGGGAAVAGVQQSGGAQSVGAAGGSPGVGSGNIVQLPVSVPLNACGNQVGVISILNPVFGNHCADVPGRAGAPAHHCPPHAPAPVGGTGAPPPAVGTQRSAGPQAVTPAQDRRSIAVSGVPGSAPDTLAMTGAGDDLGYLVPAGAAMLVGGLVLYRRSRRRLAAAAGKDAYAHVG